MRSSCNATDEARRFWLRLAAGSRTFFPLRCRYGNQVGCPVMRPRLAGPLDAPPRIGSGLEPFAGNPPNRFPPSQVRLTLTTVPSHLQCQ
jgi:hypothetical protein